ncbi:hypothetical protein B0J17DRAFT_176168 [Rhizoctonia solani]|nr:hypothetical protein B0J17DRAFT_176168 [Rhizoctonia solani]
MRPSIFQSSNNEGFRRVMTTPNPLPSNSGYSGIPRFADFGEPPARPIPTNGGVRARVASLGNYPPSLPATSRQGSSSSNMFGSRPAALPVAGEPRQPRTFQQTQSLPAGSLEFGIGTGHGVSTLEPLDEDEPWRQHDFSRYASIPPE